MWVNYIQMAIVIAAIIMIAVAAIKAMGWNIPQWAVTILVIIVITFLALLAVRVVATMGTGGLGF